MMGYIALQEGLQENPAHGPSEDDHTHGNGASLEGRSHHKTGNSKIQAGGVPEEAHKQASRPYSRKAMPTALEHEEAARAKWYADMRAHFAKVWPLAAKLFRVICWAASAWTQELNTT